MTTEQAWEEHKTAISMRDKLFQRFPGNLAEQVKKEPHPKHTGQFALELYFSLEAIDREPVAAEKPFYDAAKTIYHELTESEQQYLRMWYRQRDKIMESFPDDKQRLYLDMHRQAVYFEVAYRLGLCTHETAFKAFQIAERYK